MRRGRIQKLKDFITFPLRSLILFEYDKWGLSSLRSERYDYVANAVIGYCLDVGCGRYNLFISKYLNGNGKGIDVFLYEGLTEENIVRNITHFPFGDCSFDSVTLIANINHIPESIRIIELKEVYRCAKWGGNIIVTMGNPLAEILIHKVIQLYDRIFGTNHDIDSVRGMHREEKYYLTDLEITRLLAVVGFKDITKSYFITQWCLNHLFVGWKK